MASIAYTPRVSTTTFYTRPPSQQTQASGASYQLILEHILSYTGTYEIPLKTMYDLNSTPGDGARARDASPQQRVHRHQHSRSSGGTQSSNTSGFTQQQEATAQFTSSLIYHITQLPSQPCSLSPPLITNFLRRCFTERLSDVDFPQSLTGLDYLKDLETRRRRELAAALRRLGVDREALGASLDDISRAYPGLASWVCGIEMSERKVSALYTQLYLMLRKWILINEMQLQPFNKHKCSAMLNTLYPPTNIADGAQPTPALTPEVLNRQRDGMFQWINKVEKSGPKPLAVLMEQGMAKPTDQTSWPAVYKILDKYLRVANSLIDECASIVNSSFDPGRDLPSFGRRKGKKIDSGVSFGSHGTSSTSGYSNYADKLKSLPSPPLPPSPPPNPFESKGLSTLERIAKEIRKLKILRRSDDEPKKDYSPPPRHGRSSSGEDGGDGGDPRRRSFSRNRAVKKFRSFSDLRLRNRSTSQLGGTERHGTPSDAPPFDKEEMQRQRLLWEAKTAKLQAARPLQQYEPRFV